ncbi:Leucyl-tRNA synthetase [gamma proteobacterium IMCC2047]|nr:Leucyl-tRNA synthetase [gamma proteobacterium IMCC2047]
MELLNEINKLADRSSPLGLAVEREALEAAVQLLAPIVPHICHALWQALGHDNAIIDQAWPQFDESALKQSSIEMVVQVNGKVRARVSVDAEADKDSIEKIALAEENVVRFIDGKTVRKVIVVPGKLINIVVGG